MSLSVFDDNVSVH